MKIYKFWARFYLFKSVWYRLAMCEYWVIRSKTLGETGSKVWFLSFFTPWIIDSGLLGAIKTTLPETTSGIDAMRVVIKGISIWQTSLCTDQKPSESEGAITPSTWEISALNSLFSSQKCRRIREPWSLGKVSIRFFNWCLICSPLFAGIKLKINCKSG